MDFNIRDNIIFGENYDESKYPGGTREFESLSLKKLEKLVKEGFVNLHGSQSPSPTAGEFLEFMREHPGFTAHGYCVSPERVDCRVTLRGIECRNKSDQDTVDDFIDLCRYANEFSHSANWLYSQWY